MINKERNGNTAWLVFFYLVEKVCRNFFPFVSRVDVLVAWQTSRGELLRCHVISIPKFILLSN